MGSTCGSAPASDPVALAERRRPHGRGARRAADRQLRGGARPRKPTIRHRLLAVLAARSRSGSSRRRRARSRWSRSRSSRPTRPRSIGSSGVPSPTGAASRQRRFPRPCRGRRSIASISFAGARTSRRARPRRPAPSSRSSSRDRSESRAWSRCAEAPIPPRCACGSRSRAPAPRRSDRSSRRCGRRTAEP
jgi:hypothetical protein